MDAMMRSWEELIKAVRKGEIRALSRMISAVENREKGWEEGMRKIYPFAGSACTVGITGSPGSGKSTLTNIITQRLVEEGHSVGIIAVDPSSPFSGGALLGDRLRMQDISAMDRVFIRSMATRGVLGGLCQAARDVARILDASGRDVVIIETVGVGQDEIEVVRAADFVLLVVFPGLGDGIQVIKAGTMEIADLFVVNKADRDGADEMASEIAAMLELSTFEDRPMPGIVRTSAIRKTGIGELMGELKGFMERKRKMPFLKPEHVREEILTLVEREISCMVRRALADNGRLKRSVEMVLTRASDPYTAVSELLPLFVRDVHASGSEGGLP